MSQFRKNSIGVGIGIAVLAILASHWSGTPTEDTASPTMAVSDANPVLRPPVPIPPRELLAAAAGRDRAVMEPDLEQMIQGLTIELREAHGHEIENLRFQVSLMGLRDDLIASYPEQGAALFDRILRSAFPQLADQMLALIAKMDRYDSWLLGNILALNTLSPEGHEEALWAKRYELFSDDADLIWDLELGPEEERRESMQATVEMLDAAYETPLPNRLSLLTAAFETNYAGTYESMALDSRGVIAQVFFGFDSVQEDLSAMTAEQRQDQINDIRRNIGFDEQVVQQLAERDLTREARWQNGYAYMEARGVLEARYGQNAVPENELDMLREQYFQHEAPTIKREETDIGFYRYNRPRVYGRN